MEKNHHTNNIQTITDLGQNVSLRFSLRSSRKKVITDLYNEQMISFLLYRHNKAHFREGCQFLAIYL